MNGITFSIEEGDVLSILGPNGVGKTTLLKCLNRVLKYKGGAVMVEGQDIAKLDKRQVAKRMGYVPQRADVSRMTVFDSVLLGRRPHIEWEASKKDMKLTGRVIEMLGLESLCLRNVDEISGGEYQLVQIARALVQQPRIILLDEPTNNLDLKNQHAILGLIGKLVQANKMAAIMTTHDLNLAIRYSNKFILMRGGKILAAGDRQVITPETIKAAYDVNVVVEDVRGVPVVMPV
ncbi:MAG: ABC transporter ATP-binding protein [Candidatus Thermoplasmatota archaeon]|nr:ABC transporter ATP-binding protein [Candidatus Thermoplasmatota archaeon]